jgi:GPH family glycoside/pentoside/hexuronide:cation symporter
MAALGTRLLGGKRNVFGSLMGLSGALTAAFFVVPPTATRLMLVLNAMTCFMQGACSPLLWAMYADTADFGEWKYGRRNTGLVFSAATMAQKGGGALAGLLNGVLLGAFGYAANAPQTAQSLLGIRLTMSVVPGALCLCAASIMLLYQLDDGVMQTIRRELQRRREAA